jgi:hypothetical protein
MVSQSLAPPTGGNPIHPLNEEASSSAQIYMYNGINLSNRTTMYDTLTKPDKEKVTNGTPPYQSPTTVNPLSRSLQI